MLRIETVLLASSLALTVGCGGVEAGLGETDLGRTRAAITRGTIDSHHHAVGVFGFSMISRGLCSGTLISDRWVLTSANCAAALSGAEMEEFVEQEGIANIGQPVFMTDDGRTHAIASVVKHPSYRSFPVKNDFGLVQLSVPLAIEPAAISSRAPPWLGWVLLVGHGSTGPFTLDFGQQRRMTQAQIRVKGRFTLRYSMSFLAGSMCLMDTGGPTLAMLDGKEVIVGVHSGGLPFTCGVFDTDMRVDTVVDWILATTENAAEIAGLSGGQATDTGSPGEGLSSGGPTGTSVGVDPGVLDSDTETWSGASAPGASAAGTEAIETEVIGTTPTALAAARVDRQSLGQFAAEPAGSAGCRTGSRSPAPLAVLLLGLFVSSRRCRWRVVTTETPVLRGSR